MNEVKALKTIEIKPTKDPFRFDVTMDGKTTPYSKVSIDLNAADMTGVVTLHKAKKNALGQYLIDHYGNVIMESTRHVFRRWQLSNTGFIFKLYG